MHIRASVLAGMVAAGLAAIAVCPAQQPKVSNAQVSVRSGANLQQEVAGTQPATWIGYSIPVAHRLSTDWNDGVVRLEGGYGEDHVIREPKAGDPPPRAVILLRVTAGKIERVQIEDPERQIDGGGLPFVWLSDVRPADSVQVLARAVDASLAEVPAESTERDMKRVEDRRLRRVMDSGILAIGLHDTPEATPALRGFTEEKYPEGVREKAAFWLANERGREGFEAVAALLKSDKDDAFRVKLVFDLTLVKGDAKRAATDELLSLAKGEPSAKVRSQAQFWLAQEASRKAEGDPRIVRTLGDSAKNDPEVAIRKSAVFALSRLPEEQGVPELIEVASTSKDASTRREAIFWLGRAKDPRALAYLEKVVKE
jgi:HEAT repeat protein